MSDDSTVFVVDDDEAAADSVAALMMSVGLKVETYNSAEAFLAAYDSSRNGCLVLDIRLTGMSGLELRQTLAAQGLEIPIVLISGHADRELRNNTVKNGVVALLEKPIAGDKLCEAVRTALARL